MTKYGVVLAIAIVLSTIAGGAVVGFIQNKNDNTSVLGESDYRQPTMTEDLQDVYDILKINNDTCTKHSLSQINSATEKVHRYGQFIKRSNDLEKILVNLSSTCDDGKITVNEVELLEDLINNFNDSES